MQWHVDDGSAITAMASLDIAAGFSALGRPVERR
jgi:hypothetical protein